MPIFSVYVVELNKSICHRTACPSRDSGKPHVYVGETEQTPEERFEEHLAGGFTAARSVFKHGIRLKPRLYRNWGPYLADRNPVMRKRDLLRSSGSDPSA